MKNVVIIVATKNSNYTLAENLLELIDCKKYNVKLSSLEDFDLPLFLASEYDKLKDKYLNEIKSITDLLVESYVNIKLLAFIESQNINPSRLINSALERFLKAPTQREVKLVIDESVGQADLATIARAAYHELGTAEISVKDLKQVARRLGRKVNGANDMFVRWTG